MKASLLYSGFNYISTANKHNYLKLAAIIEISRKFCTLISIHTESKCVSSLKQEGKC